MEPDPSHPKFEDVYPRYEFAPLVRLALMAAGWIKAQFGDKPDRTAMRSRELTPPHS